MPTRAVGLLDMLFSFHTAFLFWQVIKVQEVIKEVAVDREVCILAQPFNPLYSL